MLKYTQDATGNVVERTLTANVAPQITGQPFEQVAEPGNIVTFSVTVADASAVTFQWKFNGADIPAATGDSLLLTNVSTENEGQYSVVVTNTAGSVTSAPAELLLDSDRDGLPDSWEIAHFGDTTSQRSAGDLDGDGISNLDEFVDGTDPIDNGSLRPRLTAYNDAGGFVTVTPMKLSYDLGELVTLTPTTFPPSVFAGWTGDLHNSDDPATLTMNGNKTVRAKFATAAPVPLGLIALWRGETDASDLIAGHDGTFFAGAAVTAPSITALGKVGGAFSFDGTVHVRVPDSAAVKPAQLTVEAWVFPAGPLDGPSTIIARGSSSSDFDTWNLGLSSAGNPEFVSHDNHLLQGPAIPLNEWTHLAGTFDGTTKRLYVNGAQVAARDEVDALVYDPAPLPVTIGSDWASNVSSARFNGLIDEIALYNRALTTNEILSIYNADFVGKNYSLQPYFTSSAQLPDGVLGDNYTQQMVAILGTGSVSFSPSAGVLPPGTTLSATGLVSGILSATGIFAFTVRATDAAGAFTEQLCVLQVFASVAPPAGLIGWWRAENDAQDSVGTNHGVLRNGAEFAAGRVGQAFALDGIDDCIEIPDAPALRPVSVTLEAWVTFDVTSGLQVLLNKPLGASGSYALWLEFGALKGIAVDGALSAPFSPVPGRWYHLAYTFDDGTKQQVLYVDGIQVASGSEGIPIAYEAQPLLFGRGQSVGGTPRDFLHGRLDEASIYSRALSGAEIASIFSAGAAGKRP